MCSPMSQDEGKGRKNNRFCDQPTSTDVGPDRGMTVAVGTWEPMKVLVLVEASVSTVASRVPTSQTAEQELLQGMDCGKSKIVRHLC